MTEINYGNIFPGMNLYSVNANYFYDLKGQTRLPL